MTGILRQILDCKKVEVAKARRRVSLSALSDREPVVGRDFRAAVARPGMSLIAEIKRKSPSAGVLREDVQAAELAVTYEVNGAGALSVLTDEVFFGGSTEDLSQAKMATTLPVLRKEFIVDEYQIHESRAIGADAVLLIVRVLSQAQLAEYLALATELGLAALVEVHSERELEGAIAAGTSMVGVNNRDLDSLKTDVTTSLRVRRHVPDHCVTVAESGLHGRDDIVAMEAAGFDAVLVGEVLLRAADPGRMVAELLGQVA